MRCFVAFMASALMLVFLVSPPGDARADQQAIQAVITNQMAAFRAGQADVAFSHASPTIQSLFGTPERFLSMVQSSYPPVYRPQSVTFLGLTSGPSGQAQDVDIIGPDGVAYIARYLMQQLDDGRWVINGVTLVAGQDRLI